MSSKIEPDDLQLDVYRFYQTPDGENCLEKTYYYTKYSAIAGAIFSVYEMVLVSKPKTIHASIARFGRFTLPAAGTGFAFGAALCLLGQIRKKSNWVNHLIAGSIAGTVWGAKYRSLYVGHQAVFILGGLAGYYKFFHDHNYPMFTKRTRDMDEHFPSMDFTIKLYDDPGRPDRA